MNIPRGRGIHLRGRRGIHLPGGRRGRRGGEAPDDDEVPASANFSSIALAGEGGDDDLDGPLPGVTTPAPNVDNATFPVNPNPEKDGRPTKVGFDGLYVPLIGEGRFDVGAR